MLYNKRRDQKVSSKKVLHKVRKHWVTISTALLMALGGVAAFSSSTVHADVSGNNNRNASGTGQVSSNQGRVTSPLQKNNEEASPVLNQAHQLHDQILRFGLSHVNQGNAPKVQSQPKANEQPESAKAPVSEKQTIPGVQLKAAQISPAATFMLSSNADQDQMGSDSDIGSITVRYEDLSDGNKIISSESAGSAPSGTPFQQVQTYASLAPAGFHYGGKILQGVSEYPPNGQDSILAIGVLRNRSNVNYNRIAIRYVDTSDGDKTIGYQHTQSDSDGQPFNITDFTSNVPEGFALDKSLQPSDYLKVPGIVSNDDHITNHFIPGTHLIQIGIRKIASDTPQPAAILINYVNSQNHVISHTTAPGMNNQTFDIKPYEKGKHLPAGYQFANRTSKNIPAKYNNSTVDIYVEPIPQSLSKMNINYQDETGKTVGHLSEVGVTGDHFNADQYLKLAPAGYKATGFSGQVPNVFTSGGQLNINVKQVQQALVSMTVNYQENGETISTAATNGQSGQPFFVQQFQDNVPTGFKFAGYNGAVPLTYQNGRSVNIAVKPIPKAPQNVNMNVNYINTQNQAIVGRATASGTAGSPFDVGQYQKKLPMGYTFQRVSGVPSTYQANQTINIYVAPKVQPPKIANMTIYYLYQGNVKGHVNVAGLAGSKFSQLGQYESNVPAGYHFRNVEQDTVPETFQDGHNINIDVDPVSQPPKIVQMMVSYYADGQNVGGATITGVAGRQFTKQNLQQYLVNLPAGYHSPQISGALPATYQNGRNINIDVQKNTPAMGTINIDYLTSNGMIVGQNKSVTGVVGNYFDLRPYQTNVPSGYHFVKTVQGGNISSFSNSQQTIVLQVAKNQPRLGSVLVAYFDQNGDSVGQNKQFHGRVGTSFDFNAQQQNVPRGYHFVRILHGKNVNNYQKTPQLVQIEVAKNMAPQLAQMNVDYYNGSQKVDSQTVNGITGYPFNLRAYEQNVPSGYRFDYVSGQAPSNYVNGDHIVIMISPVQSSDHPAQSERHHNAHMSVEYRDGSDVLQKVPVSGNVGQLFSLGLFKDHIPSGYHYVSAKNVPWIFQNGDRAIINVAPDSASHSSHNNSDANQNGGSSVTPSNNNGGNSDHSSDNVNNSDHNSDSNDNHSSNHNQTNHSVNGNSNNGNPTPQNNGGSNDSDQNHDKNASHKNSSSQNSKRGSKGTNHTASHAKGHVHHATTGGNSHSHSGANVSHQRSHKYHHSSYLDGGSSNSGSDNDSSDVPSDSDVPQGDSSGAGTGTSYVDRGRAGRTTEGETGQASNRQNAIDGNAGTSSSSHYAGDAGGDSSNTNGDTDDAVSSHESRNGVNGSNGTGSVNDASASGVNGKNGSRLPQTGESSSLAELLVALLSLFSLMFFGIDLDKRKKRN